MAGQEGFEPPAPGFGVRCSTNSSYWPTPVILFPYAGYGFDKTGRASHLLAEVSNIPWNERHYYAHSLDKDADEMIDDKAFKVSPFNPSRNQTYRWVIGAPAEKVAINLGVHDERGHVFEAALRLTRQPFSRQSARKLIIKKPVMTAWIVAGIYWQAMKIFLKGIPYIPYEKEEA